MRTFYIETHENGAQHLWMMSEPEVVSLIALKSTGGRWWPFEGHCWQHVAVPEYWIGEIKEITEEEAFLLVL